MEAVAHFLAMGGYARFVWPAYGLAVVVLGGMAFWAWLHYRRQRRLWEAQEQARPRRRS